MKIVKFFAAHVMPNLLFLLEILLGITAAILSAGIEYSVFNGLLNNAGSGIPVSPVSMSLLCVLCLEGTKIFLHMYIEICKTRCQALNLPIKRAQKVLFALVAISLVCTFVWSTHVLYLGVVDADDGAYLADVQGINQKYDNLIQSVKDSERTTITDRMEPYKERYQNANELYQEYKISNASQRRFEQTTAEKKRLKEDADAAFAAYENAQKAIPNEIQKETSTRISELEEQRNTELQNRKNITTTNTGANSYLHVVLMAICHYLFGLLTYSPKLYFIVTMVFAIALAGILESLIGISLHLVALPDAHWNILLQIDELPKSCHKALRMITTAFLVAAVSTILFMTYCMFQDLGVEPKLTLVAFGVFAAVNVIMMVFYPNKENIKQATPSDSSVQWPKVKSEITLMVVKGCLSFIAFVFLGTVFGNNFQELTLPAVGMTIGSVGGHLIHLPKPQEA